MRKLFAMLAVLGLAATAAQADTLFWLSNSGTSTSPQEVPSINATGDGNKLYFWGRPDMGKTLANLELNLLSTNASVLNFTDIEVHNPFLLNTGFPTKPFHRYEYLGDPLDAVDPPADSLFNFGGFTITGAARGGAGMGPATTALDPLYNPAADAFLIATVTYNVTGGQGTATDLFLQIGNSGLSYVGGGSSQVNVVFGAATDPALNGNNNRQENSATPDGTITVGEGGEECLPPRFLNNEGICVPEPSTRALSAIALLGLVRFRLGSRRKQ